VTGLANAEQMHALGVALHAHGIERPEAVDHHAPRTGVRRMAGRLAAAIQEETPRCHGLT